MKYDNDERYCNINLLNKWFAISSILFLLCFIWMFYHDNDDEFKRYQREFRKLAVKVSQEKLQVALDDVKDSRDEYEYKYNLELKAYNSKQVEIDSLNSNLEYVKGLFYKANMDYLFKKAEVDELKYLYEDEIVHSQHHDDSDTHSKDIHDEYAYKEKYFSTLSKMDSLQLKKEDYEQQFLTIEQQILSSFSRSFFQ